MSHQQAASSPILSIEGLTRQFGSLVAVDDVNLSIPPKELHSIIGPNGAGKTTLFNMIAGSLPPTSGSIHFRGTDITGLSEAERARRGIIRVFQMAQLFPELPIIENLRLAAQAVDQDFNPLHTRDNAHTDQATDMLSRLDIAADPATQTKNLSHGDKKKLEIGMALVSDPDLLLLDEPTSGVAEAESDWLMEFIEHEAVNRTILLIEHDIDMVLELSDRLTVLDRGSIIAQGTPAEISENEAVQDAYMGEY